MASRRIYYVGAMAHLRCSGRGGEQGTGSSRNMDTSARDQTSALNRTAGDCQSRYV